MEDEDVVKTFIFSGKKSLNFENIETSVLWDC